MSRKDSADLLKGGTLPYKLTTLRTLARCFRAFTAGVSKELQVVCKPIRVLEKTESECKLSLAVSRIGEIGISRRHLSEYATLLAEPRALLSTEPTITVPN